MIIPIRETDFFSVTPIRTWLQERGLHEQDHQYQFEWYGCDYNLGGDLEFYPVIHFKKDNLLTPAELTEFVLRWGV
jgi:hypothetical protein